MIHALAMMIAAQTVAAPVGTPIARPPAPAIGATVTVDTALPVARPAGRSCTVALFAEREFLGDARQPIDYRPSAACPGPWARVVVEVDFRVTAGRQFDRTNILNLGGVNLFTGTTMEPAAGHGPSWHVERDVTDYAALFAKPAAGESLLTNYVDAKYTGRVFVQARLVFFAVEAGAAAPDAPDLVTPLTETLTMADAKSPTVARALTFPRNVTRLAIDVLAQPQATDEFWAFCTPDRLQPKDAKVERPCGDPYRETRVAIDGTLVGVAPAYPWIYTGGINPYLWRATPAVDALDLMPYRVDLTPFAALVNDGRPHRIALTVAGARSFFFVSGAVLAWRDPARAVVAGAVTRNDWAAAIPQVAGALRGSGDDQTGSARTRLAWDGAAEGWLDTSRGRVTTAVTTRLRFANDQRAQRRMQTIDQLTTIETRVRTATGDAAAVEHVIAERWPLHFEQRRIGQHRFASVANQRLERDEQRPDGRRRTIRAVESAAAIAMDRIGSRTGTARSRARTMVADDRAGCIDRTIETVDAKITAVRDAACPTPP